jgi:hypothetical protein
MEPRGVQGVPAEYDTSITRGLGVPAAFYHFAFEAGWAAALADKRAELRSKGVEVTYIVDHGFAKSIYFTDPNGVSLEYSCMLRNLTKVDATMQERFTVPLAALQMKSASEMTKVCQFATSPRLAARRRLELFEFAGAR